MRDEHGHDLTLVARGALLELVTRRGRQWLLPVVSPPEAADALAAVLAELTGGLTYFDLEPHDAELYDIALARYLSDLAGDDVDHWNEAADLDIGWERRGQIYRPQQWTSAARTRGQCPARIARPRNTARGRRTRRSAVRPAARSGSSGSDDPSEPEPAPAGRNTGRTLA